MRKFIRLLTNPSGLRGVGIVVVIVLLLTVGRRLGWNTTTQLLIIIALLVLCVAWLAARFAKANKGAAAIEASMSQQAEQQLLGARPDKQADIARLKEQLEAAIGQLKESKLGRGKRGKAALYALPWYIFVGPPGSGKTTAIVNSGLNFPIGNDRVRGVGGTKNCDWFFSDSAVLLDTAGRYMTEHEDGEEWTAFLETLKEHRPERPINGVIVGISVNDLADATPDQIEWHADNMRRRLDELLKLLGVKFPVYLAFTKIDLLQGFTQFFGELSRRERDQIWGCTLDKEQWEGHKPRATFETEFDQIAGALVNHRSERLREAMKREDRQRVYVFPLEFAGLKDNLSQFVERLFRPNPYQETPIFRGFYFTSGTQEGVPIDRVIQSMAAQFNISAPSDSFFDAQVEAKSYFIKDVFSDVIIPDQYLVTQTSRAAKQKAFVQAGAILVAAIGLGLFLVAATFATLSSKKNIRTIASATEAAALVSWENSDDMSQKALAIDSLNQIVEQFDKFPPVYEMGLSQRGSVVDRARSLLAEREREFVFNHPFQEIQARLIDARRTQTITRAMQDSLFSDLRAYLLLTEQPDKLEDKGNREFILEILNDRLDGWLDRRQVSVGSSRARMTGFVESFVDGLATDAIAPFESDVPLVAAVRSLVHETPSVASLYDRIRRESEALLDPVTLESIRGADRVFAGSASVSGFYTRRGLDVMKERVESESQEPERLDWVLGMEQQAVQTRTLPEKEQLVDELMNRYLTDYSSAWKRFLRSTSYRRDAFSDVGSSSRTLESLGDPTGSPLVYLLTRVASETQFEQLAPTEEAGAFAGSFSRILGRIRGQRPTGDETRVVYAVDRYFEPLHALKPNFMETGEADQRLESAVGAFDQLGRELSGLTNPADAFEFAQVALDARGDRVGEALRAVESAVRRQEPDVRRLFEVPVGRAWDAVLRSAGSHVNDRWKSDVVGPFNDKIAGRYPISSTSTEDIPINDFEDFFGPDGTLTVFREEVLNGFVDESGRVKSWEGEVSISRETFAAFEKGQQIRDALFDGQSLGLRFELQTEEEQKEDPSVQIAEITIDIGGDPLRWVLGIPVSKSWRWPARDAKINVDVGGRRLPAKERIGDWGWFRLLQDASRIERRRSAQYGISWKFDRGVTVNYRMTLESSDVPFDALSRFFDFRLPGTIN